MGGNLARVRNIIPFLQIMVLIAAGAACGADDTAFELDQHRLWGRAYYENDKYEEAAAEYRRCIELAPNSAVDHFNLGLVIMRSRVYEESFAALDEAERLDPDLLAVPYIRGIIQKRLGEYDPAIASLQRVLDENPVCFGAWYNLGVCYKGLRQHEDAIRCFEKAIEIEPTNPSTHYQLIGLFRQVGNVEKVAVHREIFAQVRDTVDESEKTVDALERSQYSYIIDPPRLQGELEPRTDALPRFVDVTASSGLAAPESVLEQGAVALVDYDRDGDRDVYLVLAAQNGSEPNRLYRNTGDGTFEDVTTAAGVGDDGAGLDVTVGDFDNDGTLDLYVANRGANVLYRNLGDGTFEDVSEVAGVDEPHFSRTALFFDYDHDDDLDIFVGNGADLTSLEEADTETPDAWRDLEGEPDALLRNRGDGTFSDFCDEAGLLVDLNQTRDALIADVDGDLDTDLLLINDDAAPQLFLNARLGQFSLGGVFMPPLPGDTRAVGEGDFDHDGDSDLIVGAGSKLILYTQHVDAEFSGSVIFDAEPEDAPEVTRVEVVDTNDDGWTDLVVVTSDGRISLFAGAGPNVFEDVSSKAGLAESWGQVVDVASGDLDGDGDADILVQTADRGPVLLENEGRGPMHWIEIDLVGKKVNKSGLGSIIEIASGGHYQRQTYSQPGARFGVGTLEGVDVVRVTWTNGVAQNVLAPDIDSIVSIEEEVKVSASCGFLYAFDGSGFTLVNEILGIGPLGVPMAPGQYHQPDTTELTKIESHQLAPHDGFYELRLTEELRETMYADAISLRVVDHPQELELIPNEMFVAPPFPEDRFFAVGDHRPPRSAVDDRGTDVRELVLEQDGRFPTFSMTPYEGLAEPHSVTLDLGDLSGAEKITLYLDAWIYWPESSTVMAIDQDPRFGILPLSLEVPDEHGQWHVAIESVGLPTSKGLVVPVELTGRFLGPDYRVRLSTTLCVYFDRVFVSTHDASAMCRVNELAVDEADLHYRGFSAMRRDRYGFERFDYATATATGSWSPPAGLLTRYGDVTPLLESPDNMYVIFGPGDELSLRFDARSLPELPEGWTRDFIFYANGWVKDGDLNTKFSEAVRPLPFHGMSGYPYPETEAYPDTPELRQYQATWNTRPSLPTVGRLVSRN